MDLSDARKKNGAVLWGAQTEGALLHFARSGRIMPLQVIHAIAWIKWAAAQSNLELQRLPEAKAQAIKTAAMDIAEGRYDAQFPLSPWQSGSGTQSHMNVNEVIATLANQHLAAAHSTASLVHPNDDVNLGQSSNDVFPSAMHIAVLIECRDQLLPALKSLRKTLNEKARLYKDLIKIGRTHMQDATPITLGQELSGYEAQLAICQRFILYAIDALHALALGGTAVGTGLNTHPAFASRTIKLLSTQLGLPLVQANNLFAAMAGHEALAAFHAALKGLALALLKIGNDIRLMGSGPRAGLGELHLPENEPGSSIMPGKVNPTQIEALTMMCIQVIGHDAAVSLAASQGQFELNTYRPLIAMNCLESLHLLARAMNGFNEHCLKGIVPEYARIKSLMHSSLMLVTALTPHIGYEKSAKVAQTAHAQDMSLREAALLSGFVTARQFDEWVDPAKMLAPQTPDEAPGKA